MKLAPLYDFKNNIINVYSIRLQLFGLLSQDRFANFSSGSFRQFTKYNIFWNFKSGKLRPAKLNYIKYYNWYYGV